MSNYKLTHLKQLEAESIHIIREVAAELNELICSSTLMDYQKKLYTSRKGREFNSY